MARVAIVIVTYNSAAHVGGCLDALAGAGHEIIVVDNNSADNTMDEVTKRNVRYIANRRNAGFAAAVNQGVRATAAPQVLLLNPDAHLVSGLESMAAFAERERAGAVGGRLVDEAGHPQQGFMARNLPSPAALTFEVLGFNRLWPSNPVNRRYRCLEADPMEVTSIGQPAGAFLLFSRAAWEKVGGFDEHFWPLWFEDVDFCSRLIAAGFRNFYYPHAVAKHAGAHSIGSLAFETRERYWYGSLLEYAARHYTRAAFTTTCVAVVLGAAFRAVRAFPHLKFRVLEVYGGVVRLALRRAFSRRQSTG